MKTGIEIVADLITSVLGMDGMHPDTRRLLEAAREAQITGKMPDLKDFPLSDININQPKP
jgi:hypothetical protein